MPGPCRACRALAGQVEKLPVPGRARQGSAGRKTAGPWQGSTGLGSAGRKTCLPFRLRTPASARGREKKNQCTAGHAGIGSTAAILVLSFFINPILCLYRLEYKPWNSRKKSRDSFSMPIITTDRADEKKNTRFENGLFCSRGSGRTSDCS